MFNDFDVLCVRVELVAPIELVVGCRGDENIGVRTEWETLRQMFSNMGHIFS